VEFDVSVPLQPGDIVVVLADKGNKVVVHNSFPTILWWQHPTALDCSNLDQMQQLFLIIQKIIPAAHTIVLGENNTVKIGVPLR
jgi:hypothetical protein